MPYNRRRFRKYIPAVPMIWDDGSCEEKRRERYCDDGADAGEVAQGRVVHLLGRADAQEERGHVGVYLIKGLENGIPE